MAIISRQMQRCIVVLQRERGWDDEERCARRFNKEEERGREHRKKRGMFVGDSETPSSCLIKKIGDGDSDSKNTTLSQ